MTLHKIGYAKRSLIWKRDAPDHRDYQYRTIRNSRLLIPKTVDISHLCSAVDDQLTIGSCVANSITNAVEYLYKKSRRQPIDLSRLFLYYFTRVVYERVPASYDSGAEIRNGIKAMAKFGSCLERTWPYMEERFSVRPSPKAIKEAQNHQLLAYYRLTTLQQIKSCLASGYPVVGGFDVPASIMSRQSSESGIVNFPRPYEMIIGGHAILFTGYNDTTKLLKFKNSWGTKWGNAGYGYLPYRYIVAGLACDFWTITKSEL